MRPLMIGGGAAGETGKNKQKLDDDRRWFLIIGILSDKVDGISPVKREKTSPSTISTSPPSSSRSSMLSSIFSKPTFFGPKSDHCLVLSVSQPLIIIVRPD